MVVHTPPVGLQHSPEPPIYTFSFSIAILTSIDSWPCVLLCESKKRARDRGEEEACYALSPLIKCPFFFSSLSSSSLALILCFFSFPSNLPRHPSALSSQQPPSSFSPSDSSDRHTYTFNSAKSEKQPTCSSSPPSPPLPFPPFSCPFASNCPSPISFSHPCSNSPHSSHDNNKSKPATMDSQKYQRLVRAPQTHVQGAALDHSTLGAPQSYPPPGHPTAGAPQAYYPAARAPQLYTTPSLSDTQANTGASPQEYHLSGNSSAVGTGAPQLFLSPSPSSSSPLQDYTPPPIAISAAYKTLPPPPPPKKTSLPSSYSYSPSVSNNSQQIGRASCRDRVL